MNLTSETSTEVCKVLDALTALSVDLSCHCELPPDTLILSAQKTRDACSAIDEAVGALKTILQLSEAAGGGPIPAKVVEKIENAEK